MKNRRTFSLQVPRFLLSNSDPHFSWQMPGLMRPHLAEHNEVLPTPLQAKKCRGVKLDKLRSFVNPYQGLVLCLYHHHGRWQLHNLDFIISTTNNIIHIWISGSLTKQCFQTQLHGNKSLESIRFTLRWKPLSWVWNRSAPPFCNKTLRWRLIHQ